MAYLPIFLQLQDRKVLVVGGGKIAAEKLEKLVDFTKAITVISKENSEETHRLIQEHGLTHYPRPYQKGDIDGFDIVIVATDTVDLHQAIYEESRSRRMLVNSVDNTDYCDFIFPSYIKRDDLTIAFSTGSASPAFAKAIRRYFEARIPDSVSGFLKQMKSLRTTLPKGKARMAHFEKLVRDYFDKEFKR